MVKFNILRFNVVPSTMDIAKTLAVQGYPEWTVVVANEQTGGKGRFGRKWYSPRGGLWFSIILRPHFRNIYLALINMCASVAVVKSINDRFKIKAVIKWPNDILVDHKKVAGILMDASLAGNIIEHVILGIGINTNIDLSEVPEEYQANITSLKELTNTEISNDELLNAILINFFELYKLIPDEAEKIVNLWKENSSTIGSYVKVKVKGRELYGKAIDIDEYGRLLLRMDDGSIIRIEEGEVIHLIQN